MSKAKSERVFASLGTFVTFGYKSKEQLALEQDMKILSYKNLRMTGTRLLRASRVAEQRKHWIPTSARMTEQQKHWILSIGK